MKEATPKKVSELCRDLHAAEEAHKKKASYASALKVQHIAREIRLTAYEIRDAFKVINGGKP